MPVRRSDSPATLEVPIKRILLGTPPEKAVSRGVLANPQALGYFVPKSRAGTGNRPDASTAREREPRSAKLTRAWPGGPPDLRGRRVSGVSWVRLLSR
jgi:hypothetical protein